MPILAKWKHKSSIHIGFIVFNGGVTIFFAKSVHSERHGLNNFTSWYTHQWPLLLTWFNFNPDMDK